MAETTNRVYGIYTSQTSTSVQGGCTTCTYSCMQFIRMCQCMPVLARPHTLPIYYTLYTIPRMSWLYMASRWVGSGSCDSMHLVQAGCACGWLEVHGFADDYNTFWTEQILFQNDSALELIKHESNDVPDNNFAKLCI